MYRDSRLMQRREKLEYQSLKLDIPFLLHVLLCSGQCSNGFHTKTRPDHENSKTVQCLLLYKVDSTFVLCLPIISIRFLRASLMASF